MIYRAIDVLERETMLKFIPRVKHKDYVGFFNGSGCWSYLGKIGGKQQISIDDSWAITGNVIHEILHAAGMIHEHSRSDRNNFINVNYNNIKSAAKSYYPSYGDIGTVAIIYGFKPGEGGGGYFE